MIDYDSVLPLNVLDLSIAILLGSNYVLCNSNYHHYHYLTT